jgi:hypothetical protein
MDSTRKVSPVFSNNRWWNCVQTLINAKLKTGKRGQETELTGRRSLRSILDCNAIEEEEEEEEEGGG